jgi:hypothetical protein
VRKEYLVELDKVNWDNVEQNMKANYDKLNWQSIQANVDKALAEVHLDSLQTVYEIALTEIQKAEKDVRAQIKLKSNPFPDGSLKEISLAKQILQKNLDSLRTAAKPKKIIHL